MVFPALVDWFSRPSGNTGCTTCGLFRTTNGTEIPVPLKRRDVSATVYADASFADTTENLRYKSDAECSAVFRFPLPPCAAVYRFRAVFGDREVVTKVKPRAAAREEYDFAVSQGHSAVHMSQHEAGASVFEVSLGNLAAHTEVTVEFSYLRLLDAFGGTLEWSHTATWVPPYVGSAGDVATGVDKVAAALPTFAPKVTYVLSYEVTVRAEAGTVRAIESPEPVTVERPMPGIKRGEEELWYVRLSEQVADPSKDLSLAIEVDPKAARRSGLRVQRTPASRGGEQRTVALATFVPPLPSPTAAGTDGKQQQLRKEIWFVVDCSGSMDGSPINQAREAALFFVRDLPVDSGVRFNMTVFGSSHKSLYDSCKPYDSKTEKEAVTWIQSNVHADMGGTEIRQTLESIYYTPIAAGYTREVIFLTDGGISGHEEEWMIKTMVSRRRDAASPLPQGGGRDSFARFGPLAHFDSFGPFAHFGPFAKFWNAHPPAPGTTAEQQLQQLEAALQAKVAVFMEYDQHPPHRLQCELQTVARALRAQRAAKAARSTHVLCMGIGHGVHRGLLDGMASASDGAAVYVVEDEGIVAKAAFLKQIAIGRHGLVNVRVRASSALVKMAPHVLPQRVFAGEPLHVLMEVVSSEPDAALELTADWAELPEAEAAGGAGADADTAAVAAAAAAAGGKGDESSKESAASKAGEGAAEQAVAAGVATAVPAAVPAQLLVSLPLGAALLPSPDGKPTVQEGEALPVLHAMAYIGSLMAGTSPLHVRSDGTTLAAPPSADTVKEAVVRLAVAEHLVTPHTSAVGVSLRRDPAAPEAAANVVEVPLQLPHGRKLWGTASGAGPMPPPMAVCFAAPPMAQRGGRMACMSASAMACAPMMACSAAPAAPPCPVPQMASPQMMWCGTAPGGGGGRGSAAPAATNQAFASADLSLRGEKIEALSDLSCGVQQEAQCFTKKALKKKSAAASLGDAVGGAMGSLFGGLFGSGSRGASAVCAKPAQQALQGPGSAGGSCVAAEFAAPCGAAAPEAEQEESCCDDGADEMEAGDCDAGFSVPAMKESVARRSRSCSASPPAAAAAPAERQLRGSELLAFLNLKRTTQGYWAAGPELAAALGVPVVDLTSAAGAAGSGGSTAAVLRPAGLTDDAWATVVVLAVLRRCLAAQREVWADMEAKALAWLAAAWPEGGRSVGSTVMALAKALTVEA